MKYRSLFLLLFLLISGATWAQPAETPVLEQLDVFDIEFISDPQISPDGERVVYQRNFKDIKTDGNRSNLWVVNYDGTENRPLTSGRVTNYSPRWSPDGRKLLYLSSREGSPQLYLRWMDSGIERRLTNFTELPGNIQWSPDGEWIAFTMAVPSESKPFVQPPRKPQGAEWEEPPVFIDKLQYRYDGAGYLKNQYTHIFLLPADGGHPRQLTHGDYDHGGDFTWSKDGSSIIFSANRHENAEYDPRNSEIYEIDIDTREVTTLTDRQGPDGNPKLSPDGSLIAYTGFDDAYQGYQVTQLYVMNRDGGNSRLISGDFDRSVSEMYWMADNKGLLIHYLDEGRGKIAHINLQGKVTELVDDAAGLSLGRPYTAGAFAATPGGRFAYTHSAPDHPADLAVGEQGGEARRLTNVNQDLFSHKQLGEVEEIWFTSSYDGRRIQGWICHPSDFDPGRQYPLILEIHGGPFAAYGPVFSMEVQLYAAAGYVVLYTNPRGSSSYGGEFGNLIHHSYPGNDYHDLMSGVDAVIERGYVDTTQLFITGGSGGGVLTAWTVGKTDRFRAAVVAKPVINWSSFVLHSDNPAFFYKYWFPGYPWEYPEHYWARSPLSLAGNVTTPTMLLTGEEDYRTPISESEQFYAALRLNKVPSALVRIQGSGHGIANKPSNLMYKVNYILAWFEKHRKEGE
jgi:dipeptidyl aminopeptidase/acylaminoacyl peptidase